jgi:hypothetical protein
MGYEQVSGGEEIAFLRMVSIVDSLHLELGSVPGGLS